MTILVALKTVSNRLKTWFKKDYDLLKKYYQKEVYFQVFYDMLFLMKDMNLSSEDLDKFIKYFEEKIDDS